MTYSEIARHIKADMFDTVVNNQRLLTQEEQERIIKGVLQHLYACSMITTEQRDNVGWFVEFIG